MSLGVWIVALMVALVWLAWRAATHLRRNGWRGEGAVRDAAHGAARSAAAAVSAAAAEPAFVPPATPIELRLPASATGVYVEWLVWGLLLVAGLISFGSGSAWRFVAWPAAVIVSLAVAVAAWGAVDAWRTRIVATSLELVVRSSTGVQRVTWQQVAAARIAEFRVRPLRGYGVGSRVVSRHLVLSHADQQELLKLPLPLRPAEAEQLLLASIPVWTGRPLERETTGS